jgi:glycosyltransferase involved in cell wall biosynthesis
MARGLVQAGHRVTMIAEVPNHPSGIVPAAYRGKWYERGELDGIDVLRVWVKASPVKNFKSRMAFYLSYMANGALVGALKARGPFDVVYATSPPLFVGAAGLALHGLKRAPFVFEVRDLWPESAVALGELSSPRAIAWAGKLEELCYNRASRIVVVTEGIRQRLLQRGYAADKLALIPNGANTDLFQRQPELGEQFRSEHGLGDAFVAVYAGIHGIAQGLETLLHAADLLRNDPGVRFVLVGEGPVKAELQALRAKLGLDNVLMLPEQPRSCHAGHPVGCRRSHGAPAQAGAVPGCATVQDVRCLGLRSAAALEHRRRGPPDTGGCAGRRIRPTRGCHRPGRSYPHPGRAARPRPHPRPQRPALHRATPFAPGSGADVGAIVAGDK